MNKSRPKYITEFGIIHNLKDFLPDVPTDSFDEIYLDDSSFQNLKNFIAENDNPDPVFIFCRKKGFEQIQVKNYVGMIETRQGTVIEILPKIYRKTETYEESEAFLAKSVLLRMLKTLRNTPFHEIDEAHLRTSRMPLFEIFITIFLVEMEKLIKRGIKHHYTTQNKNQNFLRGKLQFSENIKKNIAHRERFFVQYDEFNVNIPQNRVLKTTLAYLKKQSCSAKNISKINNYFQLFSEVEDCSRMEHDLMQIANYNRLFSHYDRVLRWAKVFLQGQSFTNYNGKHLNAALLFPMEVLFESYVAFMLKKQHPEWIISIQDRQHHLATDLNYRGKKSFRIRPDLVINKGNEILVADTKWKIIDENNPQNNYGISQSDMYQLFAYGKKYNTSQLALIYPLSSSFQSQLCFKFEDAMRLTCYPYNIECLHFKLLLQ